MPPDAIVEYLDVFEDTLAGFALITIPFTTHALYKMMLFQKLSEFMTGVLASTV
jgi:hypothetical protein